MTANFDEAWWALDYMRDHRFDDDAECIAYDEETMQTCPCSTCRFEIAHQKRNHQIAMQDEKKLAELRGYIAKYPQYYAVEPPKPLSAYHVQ